LPARFGFSHLLEAESTEVSGGANRVARRILEILQNQIRLNLNFFSLI